MTRRIARPSIGQLATASYLYMLMAPTSGFAQAPPAYLDLTTVVRDFTVDHPDFAVGWSVTPGPVAGNVAIDLDRGRPVYTGDGYVVADEWCDAAGRQIAPHLYNTSFFVGAANTGVLLLVEDMTALTDGDRAIKDLLESWSFVVNLVDANSSEGDRAAALAASVVAYVTLEADEDAVRDILSDAAIGVVNENTDARNELGWPPGGAPFAADDMYVSETLHYITDPFGTGSLDLFSSPQPLSPLNPGFAQGLGRKAIDQDGALLMTLAPGDALFPNGTAPARRVQLPWGDVGFDHGALTDDARVLLRRAIEWGAGADSCQAVSDTSGTVGPPDGGAIASAETFGHWFRDEPGVNMSGLYTLTLAAGADWVFEYATDDFRPIDSRLFGNGVNPYNRLFTCQIVSDFVYEGCAGQFIEFGGSDDAWLFIDGRLVMDLGGLGDKPLQHVDLDRLGLSDGRSYRAHFFYAQRGPLPAPFRLRTNVVLSTDAFLPTISAVMD